MLIGKNNSNTKQLKNAKKRKKKSGWGGGGGGCKTYLEIHIRTAWKHHDNLCHD